MPELESALVQLETSSLIRLAPDEIDLSYIFKHALTQDAAYGTLLKSRRAELHRRVAEAIEVLWPDRHEENAAVLAQHYAYAGLDDKAFAYAVMAGDVARRAFAHQEALDFYGRALVLGERLGDPRVRAVYSNRGTVFELMSNFSAAIENYNVMISSAQRRGDRAMEADALNHLLTTQGSTGHVPDAEQQLERALGLARQSGDQELIVRVLWNIGLSVRFQDPLRAADYFRQARDQARAANLRELAAFALLDLNLELQHTGQWRASLECGQQALEEFRALDNPPMIANALGMLSISYQARGESTRARAAAEEGFRIGQAIDNPWQIGYNDWNLLASDIDAGEFDHAVARAQRILAVTEQMGISLFVSVTKIRLARVYLELGQLDRAQTLADEGAQALDTMQASVWLATALGTQAWIAVQRRELNRAHDLLDPLWREGNDPPSDLWGFSIAGPAIAQLALAEHRSDFGLRFCNRLLDRFEQEEMWRYAAEMRYHRARFHLAQNDWADAETDLTRARAIADNAGSRILAWRIDAALAALYHERGEPARADAPRRHAIDLIHALANGIADETRRDAFLHGREVIAALGLFKYD